MEIDRVNIQESKLRWLIAELRSDHAGETGAISIYNGVLAVSRDNAVKAFALKHRATEERHLELLETILPKPQRSLLLPVWRAAGYVTGAIPALVGPNAVFATVAAVECFVDSHYLQQIECLAEDSSYPEVREILECCRLDEIKHRDEAISLQVNTPNFFLKTWCWLVTSGSKFAVALARRG